MSFFSGSSEARAVPTSFPSRRTVILSASLDLLQPMSDVDDPPVLALQLLHQGKESFHIVGIQRA